MILQLIPEYRDYVWGGNHLRPGQRTAEAWVAFDGNRVAQGPWADKMLGEVVASLNPHHAAGFPLLIKLLDCADWLSVQVHPNDEQAIQLEGAGKRGKTEAWHVLDCAADAQLIAGIKPGVTPQALASDIQNSKVMDDVQYLSVHPGDTVFMPAGTIHALGPGMQVYEVQQASDITYRVYDWGRPATANRPLHIAQSLAVVNANQCGQIIPAKEDSAQEVRHLVSCAYFDLDMLALENTPLVGNAPLGSMHTFTVIEGEAELASGWERVALAKNQTVCFIADETSYRLTPREKTRILRASVATS
ncbi:MAG TPA: class I mannose-6-phosphate isomerase [Thermoflexales bacterium]|nr:class I mannose-6-phosphate isomerase [Thermoflexales bacterium]